MKLFRYLLILIAAVSLSAAPPQKKKTPGKAPAAATTQLLDINTATEQELRQLPGIGDAYSAKIVQNRPYRAKNELVQKKIVPAATYEKIKDRIVARQTAAKKK